ncbi:MAG: DegT/DnrJ/EryC1/StrS family aminotransferase [Candidatus Omnitrophica bacterium]|nr:DegT/DnrJ/EryC1/StrS family aminotransferase [Candidatus Omnitrophota bacterium]
MNIPMLDLKRQYQYMKSDIDTAIKNCLEHQLWIMGPEVKQLEEKIREFLEVKNCAGCCSGTEAIVLALRAFAIKSGSEFFSSEDEIITTPFTFTATADAIVRSGATPIFIDIDPVSFNINPDAILKYLKCGSANKAKGIIPVHLYGTPCDMEAIGEIAKKYNLFILEDVAQAFGGKWKNKMLGSIGNAGAFSFFPSKNLGCFGDGGMVSTNDDEIAEITTSLIKHGGKDKYNVQHIGYNARLDTIQASILLAKFKYVEEFNNRRIKIAKRYNEGLSEIEEIQPPSIVEGAVFHQYTIRIKNGRRNELQTFLKQRSIATMVYYPFCLHQMQVFENRAKVPEPLVEAEKASKEVLSLPIEPLMTIEEQDYVIETIKEFFRKI